MCLYLSTDQKAGGSSPSERAQVKGQFRSWDEQFTSPCAATGAGVAAVASNARATLPGSITSRQGSCHAVCRLGARTGKSAGERPRYDVPCVDGSRIRAERLLER